MITLSLLNENQKTNNLSCLVESGSYLVGTILASLLGETENFSDPKTKTRVPAIEPTHSYKIFLK